MFKPFITRILLLGQKILNQKVLSKKVFSKQMLSKLILAAVATLGLTGTVLADANRDFQQPILIDADDQELDMQVNRVIVRNNVIITQGSLRIMADRLEVISDADSEFGEGEVFIATGSPATYQQEVEPSVLVEASADEIRYDARARVLTLHGNAQMLQSGNQVNANRITYYVNEQRVTAERDEDSEERVRTIFQPRQNNNG